MRINIYSLCLIVLSIAQLARCMEKQHPFDIVIHIAKSEEQAASSTESVAAAPATDKDQAESANQEAPSSIELAKKAVRVALGEGNDYLERMLARRIEGKKTTPKIIPVHRIPETSDRKSLRERLSQEAEQAKETSLHLLETADSAVKSEPVQEVTKWVLKSVLDEKLQDRTVLENSNYWKYINGILVLIVPVATNLIQYYLHHNCDSGSNQ